MSRYNKDIFENQIHGKADIKTGTGGTGEVFAEGGSNAISASFVYGETITVDTIESSDNVINIDSNVGIGGAPSTTLHVQATDPRVRVDATADNHPGFELSEAGSRKWVIYNQPDSAADSLNFKSTTDRFEITPDGKGVNTLITPAIADFVDNECVGEIIHLGSTTTVAGDLYFFHTDGAWYTTDADNVDYGGTELLGVALGTNSGTHGMMVRGITRVASANVEGTPALGVSVYISESHTAQFDFTAPSAGGDYVRRLGHCLAIDSGNILLLFNPSLEHTAL